MPTNLDETAIAGSKWRRCVGVNIRNPYNATPVIQLLEETVMVVDGVGPIVTASAMYSTPFDPNADIALYDPDTGEPTGDTVKQSMAYEILYSLYRQLAAV